MAEEAAIGELLRESMVTNSPHLFDGDCILFLQRGSKILPRIAVCEPYYLLFNPKIVAIIPLKNDATNNPTKARAV